jgi:hypothetical protein
MSSTSQQFETKRGECRIEDGTLVLDESIVRYLRNLYDGYWKADSWWRKAVFVSYLFAPVFGLGGLVDLIISPNKTVVLGVAVLIVVFLAIVVYQRVVRGFTRVTHIPLDSITAVTAESGTKGLTRPRFIVTYQKNGSQRRRYIMMPSRVLPHGDSTFERARAIIRDTGLADKQTDF